MNQEAIGKFIKECRNNVNLTQSELAEKLNITDRAVSKWERGINLPDAQVMIELCNILKITVNELLSGRKLDMKEYKNISDENIIKLKQENEDNIKKTFIGEIILIITATIYLSMSVYLNSIDINETLKVLLLTTSIILFIATLIYGIIIETKVGYYECSNCHHKYKPEFKQIFFAQHMGHTRKLKCPNCHKKTWNKKIMK